METKAKKGQIDDEVGVVSIEARVDRIDATRMPGPKDFVAARAEIAIPTGTKSVNPTDSVNPMRWHLPRGRQSWSCCQ